eukprot:PhM_4_TR15205/c0_g1_i1/m.52391
MARKKKKTTTTPGTVEAPLDAHIAALTTLATKLFPQCEDRQLLVEYLKASRVVSPAAALNYLCGGSAIPVPMLRTITGYMQPAFTFHVSPDGHLFISRSQCRPLDSALVLARDSRGYFDLVGTLCGYVRVWSSGREDNTVTCPVGAGLDPHPFLDGKDKKLSYGNWTIEVLAADPGTVPIISDGHSACYIYCQEQCVHFPCFGNFRSQNSCGVR